MEIVGVSLVSALEIVLLRTDGMVGLIDLMDFVNVLNEEVADVASLFILEEIVFALSAIDRLSSLNPYSSYLYISRMILPILFGNSSSVFSSL